MHHIFSIFEGIYSSFNQISRIEKKGSLFDLFFEDSSYLNLGACNLSKWMETIIHFAKMQSNYICVCRYVNRSSHWQDILIKNKTTYFHTVHTHKVNHLIYISTLIIPLIHITVLIATLDQVLLNTCNLKKISLY